MTNEVVDIVIKPLVIIPEFVILNAMSGITYMINAEGKKTAAVIDLRRHHKLWEDFYDTVLVESRTKEPRESLDFVRRRLKLAKGNG